MTEIIFKNEPLLSPYEVDKKYDERRLSLIPYIKDLISNHTLFKDTEVSVTFLKSGASSFVCILDTSTRKLILKIRLRKNFLEGEGQFLKVWEQAGVSVPHIIEEGFLNTHSYILYDYIDAKTLAETYSREELIKKNVYREMGRILRLMHVPEAKGYGRVIDAKAEYPEFKDWLSGSDMLERIEYIKNHNLVGEEHGSISLAQDILINHANKDRKSSYCHDDFGASNIFATNPITVFDPNPRFNNGYIDLGRSLVNQMAIGIFPEQMIQGYFQDKPYDKKALWASILINSYMKLPYQHKGEKLEIIRNIQEQLIRAKYFLEN